MVCKKTYPYHPLCCRFLLVQEKSNGFQWNWSLICIQIKMQVFQYVFHSLSDFLHSHDGILLTLPLGYCTFCKPYLNQVILGEKINMGDTYKKFEIFLLITVFPSFNTTRWVKFCYQLLKRLLLKLCFPHLTLQGERIKFLKVILLKGNIYLDILFFCLMLLVL